MSVPSVSERDKSVFTLAAQMFREQSKPDPYFYDPTSWARDHIKWKPGESLAAYQADVFDDLVEHGKVAVRSLHGVGKTASVALVVLWFACTREKKGIDWKVITTASVWRQLTVYMWPEVHKWAKLLDYDKLGRKPFRTDELLKLNLQLGHGAATAVASNQPTSIEGAHADSLLYILDEAKVIPGATWDAVEGAFSGGKSKQGQFPEAFALAVSTPGAPVGRFYDIHSRKPGFEDWRTKHIKLEDAIQSGRISHDWVEQRRRQWGEDSAIFQNRVLGEFAAADEDAVIKLEHVEEAILRWQEWDKADRPVVDGVRVLGVDVARSGKDSTVLARRHGNTIVELLTHRYADTMATTGRVQGSIADGETPIVDTIGVGAGVFDRLRELGVDAIGYTGSAGTTRRDPTGMYGYVNTRSAAYYHMAHLLDPASDSNVMLPPDDELIADLIAPIRLDETSGNPPKLRIENKDDVVARLGRSPDKGDSCVMAFWADETAGQQMKVHSPASAVGAAPRVSQAVQRKLSAPVTRKRTGAVAGSRQRLRRSR